ncbi:mCG147898 [Mus musculus]|jgi:hypothetical protein|uniref:Uncharacterized protein n=1 Tax=Mus musculus TaxID=10090 RepID=Q9D2E5_MOUSE|nr:mCG147898 [Mus musculus]BAB31868.1 unnamed protein product [Mus musculus]
MGWNEQLGPQHYLFFLQVRRISRLMTRGRKVLQSSSPSKKCWHRQCPQRPRAGAWPGGRDKRTSAKKIASGVSAITQGGTSVQRVCLPHNYFAGQTNESRGLPRTGDNTCEWYCTQHGAPSPPPKDEAQARSKHLFSYISFH